ncbi:coagulation factor X-like isoform X2 [Pomacea canaliculata]|nr:coagulation factor X-like isoform X2 [Pomacea canaliculata]
MEHYEQLDGPQFHGPLTSAVSASPEQGNRPGGPATQKTLIKTFIKRFKWYYLFAACMIVALLVVVIVISVYYSIKSETEEVMSCLPSLPRVKLNYDEDPIFVALIVFFWPWSPDMEDTNSPMYEETISKAEYWVTKIFQASFLSSCIRSPAMAMMDLDGNTLVRFDLHVSCDTATEVEINRAYIDGHSFLQRTQDKSCVVSIGENLIIRRFFHTTITPLPPSETPNTICGQSQLYPVPKIVGGRPAKRGQYPWVVKLQISSGLITMKCGGSIWDYNHILTAAHCIDMLPINSSTGRVDTRGIVVIAGEWEHTSVYSYLQQNRSVASARIHRHYYRNIYYMPNDIALLKLAEPLHPTQLVMKVCHPHASTQLPKKGIVAGWGRTREEPARYPEVQQRLEVTVLNQSDCLKLLRLYGFLNPLHKGTICSIDDDLEVKGVCKGDSGGPLFANLGTRGDERYTIFGIVSHGHKCGGYFNAYASVPYYRDWIHETIQFLKHL